MCIFCHQIVVFTDAMNDNNCMRKDHIRDRKTAPKKLSIPAWPFAVAVIVLLFLGRNTLKEFFPGMSKADKAKTALRDDMEIRHPITKLYFETYKYDGAQEFANDFWKMCEDNLNNANKAQRCADLVKNLIDREGNKPVVARAITDYYCLESNFSPFCNKVYSFWKAEDSDYSLSILERSCKDLKDKSACLISQDVMK